MTKISAIACLVSQEIPKSNRPHRFRRTISELNRSLEIGFDVDQIQFRGTISKISTGRVVYREPTTNADYFKTIFHLDKIVAGSERKRELRRRRHRKKKVAYLLKKAEKGSASEKSMIAEKLRKLTPGGNELVAAAKLEK